MRREQGAPHPPQGPEPSSSGWAGAWTDGAESLRRQLAALSAQRRRERAELHLLRVRNEELGTALREVRDRLADALARLQESEAQGTQRSEERFRLLVDTVEGYAIFMLDQVGRIVSWSEGARRIIGYPVQEALGRPLAILYPSEDAARGKADRDLREASARGRFEEESWRIRRDGSPFWASTVITTLRADSGELLGYGVIARDLSDRRRVDEVLRRTATELERSNRELEQFAYVASHDLQEPLRKIIAFGDRLAKRYAPVLQAQGLDYLERMRGAAARMQALIDDVLTFSRVTRRTHDLTPVDLTRLAREAISDLEPRIAATGGSVELSELPTVEADPVQLRRVLQNLLGNALKFHRPGVPPVVRVHAEVDRAPAWAPELGSCRIFVEDNGIGFEEQYLDRIFIIFQRLHGRSEYEGTGMGLAICRKIVERHGGSITARSTPGAGSTFVITLPLIQPREEVSHGAGWQIDPDPHRGR